MADFSEQIRKWYLLNFRKLPWRKTKNSYKIWVSEIILQQTRVSQGISYYHRFLEKFPTIHTLATAKEGEILKIWQGLGYYSRARNMHKAAKQVVKNNKGIFPKTYNELIELPGIGPYTAAAISSFTINEPNAVVDGNVMRVLARYFLIMEPINSLAGKKIITELATEVLNKKYAAEHNQAIMEIGALVCTVKPNCVECPLQYSCSASEKNQAKLLPVKIKKAKTINRYITFFVITDGKQFLFEKRTEKDIWQGLYSFPNLSSFKKTTPTQQQAFLKTIKKLTRYKLNAIEKTSIHLLSHQKLTINFFQVRLKTLPKTNNYLLVPIHRISKYAVPKPIEKLISNHKKLLFE